MILELLLGVILIIYYFVRTCRKPYGFPPGPLWWPLVGSSTELRQLSKILGGQHLALAELSKRYGTNVLGLKLGNEKVVCVSSYAVVKKVLISEEYTGRPDNFFIRLRSMGKTRKGITTTDGPFWQEQRNFVMTHLRNLGFGKKRMQLMIQREIREIIDVIEKHMKDLNLQDVLTPAVLNVLWTMTSGARLDSSTRLKNLLELLKKRTSAFDLSGGLLTQYPWLHKIMPEKTGYNILKDVNIELTKLIMEAINKHKKTWTENNREDLIYSFLTEMYEKKDDKESNFTDDQLVMICLDLFIAGSQVTSNALSFDFLMMILYPQVQAKVHKCLDETFQKDEEIFFEDKQKVPYIEAVLLEIERFCQVAPIAGPRRVLRDTTLEGYKIPTGTTVLISLHSVHKDREYWKDPDVFKPERFLDQNGNVVLHNHFIPFGLGKRRCPGGDILAKTCMFLFLVEIMRKFRIEAKLGTNVTEKTVPGIIMAPEKYRARFLRR